MDFWSKKVFFAVFGWYLLFCPLDPDPWICIFLRIRIQEAKILRIQRILSTDQSFYSPRNIPARRSPSGPMGNPCLVWSRIPKLYDWWTVNTSSRDRNSRSTISRGINPLSSRGFLNHEVHLVWSYNLAKQIKYRRICGSLVF